MNILATHRLCQLIGMDALPFVFVHFILTTTHIIYDASILPRLCNEHLGLLLVIVLVDGHLKILTSYVCRDPLFKISRVNKFPLVLGVGDQILTTTTIMSLFIWFLSRIGLVKTPIMLIT